MNPLLRHARRLFEDPKGPEGVWPRATALLTRQALEEAMDRLWVGRLAGMERTNRSTQLACLGHILVDQTLVSGVRNAWHSLSRACHHHHYELVPIAAELERWIRQTERLVQALDSSDQEEAAPC